MKKSVLLAELQILDLLVKVWFSMIFKAMEKGYKFIVMLVVIKEKIVSMTLIRFLEEVILSVLLELLAEQRLINSLLVPVMFFYYHHVFICYQKNMLDSKITNLDSERDIWI